MKFDHVKYRVNATGGRFYTVKLNTISDMETIISWNKTKTGFYNEFTWYEAGIDPGDFNFYEDSIEVEVPIEVFSDEIRLTSAIKRQIARPILCFLAGGGPFVRVPMSTR